jgi:polysaccharide export outer membrane protein
MTAPMLLLPLVLGLLQAPPPQPAAGTPAQGFPPGASAGPEPVGLPGSGYRVGPGDVLQLAVYGHEEMSQVAVVQQDGSILTPLLGTIPASGATTAELQARIAARLAKGFVRDAQVSVTVRDYRSKVVNVVGEVARPGTYPLAGETRIIEILARAGPLSPNAGTEMLILRRASASGQASGGPGTGTPAAADPARPSGTVIHVDVSSLQAGRLDQNVVLEPNDTVFVPRAAQVFVTGEVRNPGAFAFREGMTARQAVALAGGFSQDASKGGARLVREVGGKARTLKVKLDRQLRPGDTVVIKAAWF